MLVNNKILIIGFGSIAKKHIRIINYLLPKAEVAILRVKSNKKVNNFKTFFNLKEAKDFNPRIVFICSAANKHIYYFSQFRNITKNIFIEKPLSDNFNSVKKIDVFQKNNFQVGYFLRFHSILIQLHKIIIGKKLGKVRSAKIHVGQHLSQWRKTHYSKSVSAKKKLGGGVLLELSHEIDYAIYLFGYPQYVYCVKKKLSNLKIQTEDSANIIFEYSKNNKIIEISLNMYEKFKSRSIKVIFDNASIKLDLLKNILTKNNKKVNLIRNLGSKYLEKLFFIQTDRFLKKSIFNYKNRYNQNIVNHNIADFKSSKQLIKIINYLNLSNKLKKRIKVEL